MEPNTKIEIPQAILNSGMAKSDQWIMAYAPSGDKKPMQRHDIAGTGQYARTNDRSTWSTLQEIMAACDKINLAAGKFIVCPGFVITHGDNFICFDIDHKNEPDAGERKKRADLAFSFMGTYGDGNMYVESSVSGKGTHAFVECPDQEFLTYIGSSFKGLVDMFGLEVYAAGQYIAMTFGYHNTPAGMQGGRYVGTIVPEMSEINMDQLHGAMQKANHQPKSSHRTSSRLPFGYLEAKALMYDTDNIRLATKLVNKQHSEHYGGKSNGYAKSLREDLLDPTYPFRTMKNDGKQKRPDMSYVEKQLLLRITARAGYFRKSDCTTALAKTLWIMRQWCFFDARIGEEGTWSQPFADGPQIRRKKWEEEAYLQYLFRVARGILEDKPVKPEITAEQRAAMARQREQLCG